MAEKTMVEKLQEVVASPENMAVLREHQEIACETIAFIHEAGRVESVWWKMWRVTI
jgi:hypothetical protein